MSTPLFSAFPLYHLKRAFIDWGSLPWHPSHITMHKWISAPAIGIVFHHLSFAVWNTFSLLSYKIFSFYGNLDQMSLTLKVVFPCHEQMEIMNRLSFEFPTRCNILLKNPYLQNFCLPTTTCQHLLESFEEALIASPISCLLKWQQSIVPQKAALY